MLKIKVMSKEKCADIAKARDVADFHSEEERLYHLPDDIFERFLLCELEDGSFQEVETGYGFYIPCWFVEKVWREES